MLILFSKMNYEFEYIVCLKILLLRFQRYLRTNLSIQNSCFPYMTLFVNLSQVRVSREDSHMRDHLDLPVSIF